MICNLTQEKLLEYLNKELTANEMNEIQTHLSQCSGCQEQLNHYAVLDSMLARTEPLEPSPDYKDKFWAHVNRTKHTSPQNFRKLLYYGIAASLVLVLSLILMRQWEVAPPVPPIPGTAISSKNNNPSQYITDGELAKNSLSADKEDEKLILEINDIIQEPLSYSNSSIVITEDQLKSLNDTETPTVNEPKKNKTQLEYFISATSILQLS
jgi:Putative zinc-finger